LDFEIIPTTSDEPTASQNSSLSVRTVETAFAPITPNPDYSPISLGIGEPRHATPQLVLDALSRGTSELSSYPLTAGLPALKESCSAWVQRRYGVRVDPSTQILPVNGTREALVCVRANRDRSDEGECDCHLPESVLSDL
jgi:N-succinyldiaminopimelate aminotransferase